jgi:hypothetical protein
MLKKYSILLGIVISISLLLIATLYYPGGSQFDKAAAGYDWKNNYISNLFGEKAINGADNRARYWAVGGMMLLSLSFAVFFVEFSKRIPARNAARVIKYFGAAAMVFTFLIATPLHDAMITIASTMTLISLFYITVFVFKSRLLLFKFLCVACLLVYYLSLFMYYSGTSLKFLPIIQKVTFATTIILILGLQYLTTIKDFEGLSNVKVKSKK